jgi:hypothetical protein
MSRNIKAFYDSEKGTQTKEHLRSLYQDKSIEEIYGKEKALVMKEHSRESCLGEKNGFYGKKHSDKTRRFISEHNKGLMSGEKNPMYGKPSPQGSGNGWSGWYKEWFFRSIRELSFMINVIERFNFEWVSAEKAGLKIPYIDYDNVERNYFADFLLNNKYLVEIKPRNLFNSPKILAKKQAAMSWCIERNLKYKLIDPILLEKNLIKEKYLNKEIIFTDRYQQLFEQRYMEKR